MSLKNTGGVALKFDGVSRRYGARNAVDGISLVAQGGQVTAILGASGSGKSTLLRLAAGLEAPDAGSIFANETMLAGSGVFVPAEQRRIGLVFQDYALFPHLSLAGNVMFGLAGLATPVARATAQTWLERVGLADRANAFPHTLSGGEQQRVSLARALAPQPLAVLLDEPFSGLDRDLRASLRDSTLAMLRATGVTVLFVTHDAEDAMLGADQIAILDQARLVQAGAPRAVYESPTSVRAATALGDANVFVGRIDEGALATPFGALQCTLTTGTRAVGVVRPEALTIVDGALATLVSRRPAGALDSVMIEAGGTTWRAWLAPDSPHAPGAPVGAVIGRRGVHVFAEGGAA